MNTWCNCELCVRASREIDGKSVFSMTGRGHDSRLQVNSVDGTLGATSLSLDDRAVMVCPVGAILPKHRGFAVPIGQRRFDRQPIERAPENTDERS